MAESMALGTDGTWKAKASPITPLGRGTAFGDYGGEHYDARLEVEDWNGVKLDDSGWETAATFDPPKVTTSAQMVEPNRILETLQPVKIEQDAGRRLADRHGQELHGLAGIAPAVRDARPAIASRSSMPTTRRAGGRYSTFNQRDEYVTRAGAGQVVCSRFNYHAFRFAHVTGLSQAPAAEDVRGYFMRTSYGRSGEFESSDELLNRIYRLVTWTYECLTLNGYVVDCPTRERLGYGGDAGTSIETGLFNFDTGGLYNRWAANWRDAQDPQSGDLPYTAPNYPDQGGGGPMWSGFVVTMPWQVYLNYGDKGILETNYPMIRKWLAFAESKTKDNILEPYISVGIRMAQWNYLGDWVTPGQRRRVLRRGPFPEPHQRAFHQQRALPLYPATGRQDRGNPGQARRCRDVRRTGGHAAAARCTNAITTPPLTAMPPASSPTWRWRCCWESFRRNCAPRWPRTSKTTILVKDGGHIRLRHARHLLPAQGSDGGQSERLDLPDGQQEGLPELGLHAGAGRHHKLGKLVGRVSYP